MQAVRISPTGSGNGNGSNGKNGSNGNGNGSIEGGGAIRGRGGFRGTTQELDTRPDNVTQFIGKYFNV